MSLLWAGASASVMILAIACLRLMLMKRLPKGFLAALWWIPLIRLLWPWALPSLGAVARLPVAAQGVVQASPVQRLVVAPVQSGIREALTPVAREMERQAAVSEGFPLWQVVWAAGTALVLAFLVISTVRGYRKFAAALPEESPEVIAWLAAQKTRRRVRVRQSDRISTPMAYGLLRPVILLPKGFAAREDTALPLVLAHEMAHIRRLDPLMKMLQWAALALHWWNPLVWAMLLLSGRDMELACDQRALQACGGEAPADFARTLLRLSQGRGKQMATPYALSFSRYALEERIQQMIKPKRRSILAVSVAVLVALAAVGIAGTAEPSAAGEAKENSWLEKARSKIAETQVIDWTAEDIGDISGLYSEERDGEIWYSTDNRQTWIPYDKLLADTEDGFVIFTYEDLEEDYQAYFAYIQASADNGAHFWSKEYGWAQDSQEAAQRLIERLQQYLEELRDRREVMYTMIEAGQDEEAAKADMRLAGGGKYTDMRGPCAEVVLDVGELGSCNFFTPASTLDELRADLLNFCTMRVQYDMLTKEQAEDILSAEFLY